MRPKRRPLPMAVPRHVAQRAVSWYKSLPTHPTTDARAHLRDINGRRWELECHDDVVHVWVPDPRYYGGPSLLYDAKTGRVWLSVYEARVSYTTGHGRVVYRTTYCVDGLDTAYALYAKRERYSQG